MLSKNGTSMARLIMATSTLLSAVGVLAFAAAPASAATGDHFTCRASALRVQGLPSLGTLKVEPAIANASNDPCGSEHTSIANAPAGLSTLLSTGTGVASATTTSAADRGTAASQVADATVLQTSLALNAQLTTASASYICQAGVPTPQSSSNVVGLRIGTSAPITTSGPVSIPVGGLADVELNRTITTATSVTRRAVDITVLSGLYGGAEIVLGEASAGTSGNPCGNGTQSGPPTNTSPPVITGNPPGGGNGGGGNGGNPGGGQPGITGNAVVNETLTCTTGAWTGNPTRFTYQWSRGGTPIQGATGSKYKVKVSDEATTLTCIVVAYNSSGASAPATSRGVTVRVPHVARCPGPSGRLTGHTLGLVSLGMTRAQAHHVYRHSSNRGRRWQDFFCLTPTGVRVGYPSRTLRHTLPANGSAYNDRVVVALTSAAYYSVHGIRPGATLAATRKLLGQGNLFKVGVNDWYFARHGSVTWLAKVRHGIVEEIGIADSRLTGGRQAQYRLITSFWRP